MNQFVSILGQILGILAMLCSVFSFQMHTHKKLMLTQTVTAILFCLHYALVGGITGAAVNAIAIVRDILFYFHGEGGHVSKKETILFSVLMAASALFSWQGLFSLCPAVGMVLNTLSLSFTDTQKVRKVILVASPLMLLYNIFTVSIGGIINESFVMVSAVIGLIRYRKKQAHG